MSNPFGQQLKPEFDPVIGQDLIPNISELRASTFSDVDPSKKFAGFCADDRHPTEDSEEVNLSKGFAKEYFRIFGGRYGVSKNVAVVIASHGNTDLSEYGGSFLEFDDEVSKRIERTSGVVFGKHSAKENEANSKDLDPASCKCMGCLYATNIGKVGLLNFEDGDVDSLARREQEVLFGGDDMLGKIKAGNEGFMNGFDLDETYSIDRTTALADGSPVSILEGGHSTIDVGVVVVESFMPDKISNPKNANEKKVPFYNNDLLAVGEMILRAFPELKIDPRLLLGVMDHDVRSTRAALAGLEGKSVSEMPLQKFGDPDFAIRYLNAIKP